MSINSCKDMKDEAEFESWSRNHGNNHTGTHATSAGYGNQGGPNTLTDPYSISGSYYHHPMSASMFQFTNPNDHNTGWSNGTAHNEMTFLTGYGTTGDATGQNHHTNAHYMDMFSSQNSFGYNFNAFFHGGTGTTATGGNDPFWGTTTTGKQAQRGQLSVGSYRNVHDDQSYYQRDYNESSNQVKHLDSQMTALNLEHIKSDQFNNKGDSCFGSNNNSFDSTKRFESLGSSNSVIGQAPQKKMSWASVASQPAKPSMKSLKTKLTAAASPSISSSKHLNVPSSISSSSNIEPIASWESKNGSSIVLKSGSSSHHQNQQNQQVTTSPSAPIHQIPHQQQHVFNNFSLNNNQTSSSSTSWNSNPRNSNRPLLQNLNRSNFTGNNTANTNTNTSTSASNNSNENVNNSNTHQLQQNNSNLGTNHQNSSHTHHHPKQSHHTNQKSHSSSHQPNFSSSNTSVNIKLPGSNANINANSSAQQNQAIARTSESNNFNQLPSNNQLVSSSSDQGSNFPSHPVLDKLRVENNYNPKEFDLSPKNARFFIIKSYSEDDIHRSIKYSIWCSTEHGNKRLDNAYKSQENKGPIFLFFSVNGSGHFCGMAQMISSVDYQCNSSVWSQDKWKGQFKVKWVYVKDVPNAQLRHIRLENNENKPVTNSRDTQEVPYEKGKAVLKTLHNFRHTTSIFDDFLHYEKRQEEENARRVTTTTTSTTSTTTTISATNSNSNSNSNQDTSSNSKKKVESEIWFD